MFPFWFPRLLISIERCTRRCRICGVYGKSMTPYDQWNVYVQHVCCTRRSLQYSLASDRNRTIKKKIIAIEIEV